MSKNDEKGTTPRKKKGKKKSSTAKKHQNTHAREMAMQALYQMEVINAPLSKVLQFDWLGDLPGAATIEYARSLVERVTDNWDALDEVIQSFSDKDITQISIINRCILRMGLVELMKQDLEAGIIIDDLLNLTRQYDGDESVSFINGILDSFEKERRLE